MRAAPVANGIVSLSLLLCGTAAAQVPFTRGYGFIAPTWQSAKGSPSDTYGAGAGVERVSAGGFGLSAELAAEVPGKGNRTIGLFSVGAAYHFAKAQATLDPFVSAGYTLFVRDFAANGVYAAAGLNYWLGENLAFTFEVRRQQAFSEPYPRTVYNEFRIGVSFR
jgi:hypothetical protein